MLPYCVTRPYLFNVSERLLFVTVDFGNTLVTAMKASPLRTEKLFLAATKQLYEWYFLSVRLAVRHTFLTMLPSSYHHKIFRSYHQGPG